MNRSIGRGRPSNSIEDNTGEITGTMLCCCGGHWLKGYSDSDRPRPHLYIRVTKLKTYTANNIKLDGKCDAESLAQKLIYEWIPYIDCERKCSRSDYCKYTEPSPHFPDRLRDVKCGIGVNTHKTLLLVHSTFLIICLQRMFNII